MPKKNSGASSSSSSSTCDTKPHNIHTVEFHTKCSLQTYDTFINQILALVTTRERRHFNLHYLPATSDIPTNHFFIVLINSKNNRVKLVVRKSDLYIIAFRNSVNLFFFNDTNADDMIELFRGRGVSKPTRIGMDAKYKSLEGGLHDRTSYPVGFQLMDYAVQSLNKLKFADYTKIAQSFLLFLQMISESCRLEELVSKIESQIKWVEKLSVQQLELQLKNLINEITPHGLSHNRTLFGDVRERVACTCVAMKREIDAFLKTSTEKNELISDLDKTIDSLIEKTESFRKDWELEFSRFFTSDDQSNAKRQRID